MIMITIVVQNAKKATIRNPQGTDVINITNAISVVKVAKKDFVFKQPDVPNVKIGTLNSGLVYKIHNIIESVSTKLIF